MYTPPVRVLKTKQTNNNKKGQLPAKDVYNPSSSEIFVKTYLFITTQPATCFELLEIISHNSDKRSTPLR